MKIKRILIVLVIFLTASSQAKVKFCTSKKVEIFCDHEIEERFSLNGRFLKGKSHYFFSARRAFEDNWCHDTLKKINEIMESDNYCITFEGAKLQENLTLEAISNEELKWSYFQ